MASTDDERKVVVKSSSEVPNNPQETNFMQVGYGASQPDEMCFAKGTEEKKSAGEEAVRKYRTPH